MTLRTLRCNCYKVWANSALQCLPSQGAFIQSVCFVQTSEALQVVSHLRFIFHWTIASAVWLLIFWKESEKNKSPLSSYFGTCWILTDRLMTCLKCHKIHDFLGPFDTEITWWSQHNYCTCSLDPLSCMIFPCWKYRQTHNYERWHSYHPRYAFVTFQFAADADCAVVDRQDFPGRLLGALDFSLAQIQRLQYEQWIAMNLIQNLTKICRNSKIRQCNVNVAWTCL